MSKQRLGTDPEFFIRSLGTGEIIPAAVFTDELTWVEEIVHVNGVRIGDFGADNAAMEIRPEPSRSAGTLTRRIRHLLQHTSTLIRERAKREGWAVYLSCEPFGTIHPRYADHDSITEIGCSLSNYLDHHGEIHRMPIPDGFDGSKRTAGFHIHVELPPSIRRHSMDSDAAGNYIREVIPRLDCVLGLLDVIYGDRRRRAIGQYGIAGEFRWNTEYGTLEYRTMSSWPLIHPKVTEWVLSLAQRLGQIQAGAIPQVPRDAVVEVINDDARSGAIALLTEQRMLLRGNHRLFSPEDKPLRVPEAHRLLSVEPHHRVLPWN